MVIAMRRYFESDYNFDTSDYENEDRYGEAERIRRALSVEHDLLSSNVVTLSGIKVYEIDFSLLLRNFSKHELSLLVYDLCEYISSKLSRFKVVELGLIAESSDLCCLSFRDRRNTFLGDLFINPSLKVSDFRAGSLGPGFIVKVSQFINHYFDQFESCHRRHRFNRRYDELFGFKKTANIESVSVRTFREISENIPSKFKVTNKAFANSRLGTSEFNLDSKVSTKVTEEYLEITVITVLDESDNKTDYVLSEFRVFETDRGSELQIKGMVNKKKMFDNRKIIDNFDPKTTAKTVMDVINKAIALGVTEIARNS